MNYENFYPEKKVLVTGGLGFLGSNLSRRLKDLGARVTILDCQLDLHGGNIFNIQDIAKEVKFVKGDIRDDALARDLIKGQDVLFNIAAQTSHTDSMNNPLLDVDINNRGQIILLEAVKTVNPGIRLVYCSSRAVYGASAKKIIDEETLPNPGDVYSVNKLAGEFYHKIYGNVHGLNVTTLRVANGYGQRAQMKSPSFGILNWFIRLAIDDQEIKVFGDGKQIRDYAHVDDIIEAFLMTAARENLKGKTFNVGSGKGIPLIDIIHRIVQIAGKGKIVHVPWPEQNKKIDVGDFVADITRMQKELGWDAKVDLDTGLKKTIQFYETHKKNYWP